MLLIANIKKDGQSASVFFFCFFSCHHSKAITLNSFFPLYHFILFHFIAFDFHTRLTTGTCCPSTSTRAPGWVKSTTTTGSSPCTSSTTRWAGRWSGHPAASTPRSTSATLAAACCRPSTAATGPSGWITRTSGWCPGPGSTARSGATRTPTE